MTSANPHHSEIASTILAVYPQTQAVYLFGSFDTEEESPVSDVDIAILLPHAEARQVGSLTMSDLRFHLEQLLRRDVDLINLRQVSTVLQKEVVAAERRIYSGDPSATDTFEMLTLSFYQKLNEERRDILEQFYQTGRAYDV